MEFARGRGRYFVICLDRFLSGAGVTSINPSAFDTEREVFCLGCFPVHTWIKCCLLKISTLDSSNTSLVGLVSNDVLLFG